MRIRTIVVAAALAISACTQTSTPEIATFEGQRLTIQAEAKPLPLGAAEVMVKIDGETVINQKSQVFGGSSQTFNGSWNGRPVSARATRIQNFVSSYTQIDVFIGGQLVETLTI